VYLLKRYSPSDSFCTFFSESVGSLSWLLAISPCVFKSSSLPCSRVVPLTMLVSVMFYVSSLVNLISSHTLSNFRFILHLFTFSINCTWVQFNSPIGFGYTCERKFVLILLHIVQSDNIRASKVADLFWQDEDDIAWLMNAMCDSLFEDKIALQDVYQLVGNVAGTIQTKLWEFTPFQVT